MTAAPQPAVTAADLSPIRLGGPADVLGVVPAMLGFEPQDSVVLVCLQGARHRSCLTMRSDLPAGRDNVPLARDLAERAATAGADAVIGVIYDRPPPPRAGGADSAPVLPRRGFARQLRRALAAEDLDLVDLLAVRGGRFWSYLCEQEACCPVAGTEIPRRPTSAALQFRAEAVTAGSTIAPSRAALAAGIAAPGPEDAAALTHLLEAAEAARTADSVKNAGSADSDGTDSDRDDPAPGLRDLHVRYRNGGARVSVVEIAPLVRALRDVHVRDRVLEWGGGSDPVSLLSLLGDVVQLVPPPYDSPVCTVFAWVAYQQGSGALAHCALDRALATAPDYTLAVLLQQALDRGVPPQQLAAACAAAREAADA